MKRSRGECCTPPNMVSLGLAIYLTVVQVHGLNPAIGRVLTRTESPTQHSRTTRLDFSPTSHSHHTSSSPCRRNPAVHSSLFPKRGTQTVRHMVLTTPESIIEQASTQKLLDDLIDESVRTVARKPIMLQFDPSSSFVSRILKSVHNNSKPWHFTSDQSQLTVC
jgi:hypothetical protein